MWCANLSKGHFIRKQKFLQQFEPGAVDWTCQPEEIQYVFPSKPEETASKFKASWSGSRLLHGLFEEGQEVGLQVTIKASTQV